MSAISVNLEAGQGIATFSVAWSDASSRTAGMRYGQMGNISRVNKWVITFSGSGTLLVNEVKTVAPLPEGYGVYCYIKSGYKELATGRDAVSFGFSDFATVTVGAYIAKIPIKVSFNAFPDTLPSTSQSRTYTVGQPYGTLPVPISPPAEYGTFTFGGWYLGQTHITSSTPVSLTYDHALKARWTGSGSGGSGDITDIYDDSLIVQQVLADVAPVRRFGIQASCRKTFPDSSENLTPFTGFTNYTDGIPSQYEHTGVLPDLSPATDGKDYTNERGYRALLQDINAIGEIATREQYFRQCGAIRTFSKAVSTVIGGYPKGAVLEYWDGTHLRMVISLMDDNDFDFTANPSLIDDVHWTYGDVYTQFNMPAFFDFSRIVKKYISDFEQDLVSNSTLYVSEWFTVPYDCCMILSLETYDIIFTATSDGTTNMGFGYQLKDSSGNLVSSGDSYNNISAETFSSDSGTVFGLYAIGPGGTPGQPMWKDNYQGCMTRTIYLRAGSSIRMLYDLWYVRDPIFLYTYAPLTSRTAS